MEHIIVDIRYLHIDACGFSLEHTDACGFSLEHIDACGFSLEHIEAYGFSLVIDFVYTQYLIHVIKDNVWINCF